MVDPSWNPARAGLVLALLLAACSPAPPIPEPAPEVSPPAASPAATPISGADPELLQRAREAMATGRLTQPAQGNAVDYYLALAQRPAHAGHARATLVELLPYVVLAAERALSERDPAVAARLAAQLEAIDPAAPALPRIRATMRELERAIAEAATVPAVAPPTATAPTAEAVATTPVEPESSLATGLRADPGGSEPVAAATPGVQAASPAPAPPVPAPAAEPPPRQLLVDAAPAYPPLARGRGMEGEVLLGFTIDPNGRVVDPHVVSADPPGTFERAALAAAVKWRFEPGPDATSGSRRLRFQLSM